MARAREESEGAEVHAQRWPCWRAFSGTCCCNRWYAASGRSVPFYVYAPSANTVAQKVWPKLRLQTQELQE